MKLLLLAAVLGLFAGCDRALADDAPTASDVAIDAPRWNIPGASPELVDRGMRAWARADVEKPIVTLIDYSRPSTEKRLWVYQVETSEVLFHELVSHGKNSGGNTAHAFSNTVDSKQSSLGVFKTAETYVGKHGRSLRLDGLEPGFNDRARERHIVIHGADYVSEDFIRARGRLGLSWGCPALRQAVAQDVIDTIAGGSLVLSYFPDADWLEKSAYVAE